jgi:hypothetical protein
MSLWLLLRRRNLSEEATSATIEALLEHNLHQYVLKTLEQAPVEYGNWPKRCLFSINLLMNLVRMHHIVLVYSGTRTRANTEQGFAFDHDHSPVAALPMLPRYCTCTGPTPRCGGRPPARGRNGHSAGFVCTFASSSQSRGDLTV